MSRFKQLGKRAIVVGAGIGGLAAARVLSDQFAEVLLLERDPPYASRKGAPQVDHIHILLRKGVEILEELFPGVLEQMENEGIEAIDFGRDQRWIQYGAWLCREPTDIRLYPQTRRSLEGFLRRYLDAYRNVEIRSEKTVRELLASPDRGRVTGVRVTSPGDSRREDITADLVIDASGRSGKFRQWLDALGYDPPEETRLPIDLRYATRMYQAPAEPPGDWRGLWVSPLSPRIPRGGALQYVEDNRWVVSLFGYHGDHPQPTDDGFEAFAKTLIHPSLYETIKNARPLGETSTFRVPYQRWSHLERIKRFPDGFLVLGDAYCNFDPVFGQGMTVALLEAQLLRQRLQKLEHSGQITADWARRYFRECCGWIRGLWYFVNAEALRHPKTPGKRTWLVRLLQWYVSNVYGLSSIYPDVYVRFLQLTHLRAGPEVLLSPRILSRLAMRVWRQRATRLGKTAP